MKTSLAETIQIEEYLDKNMPAEDQLVFEARLQIEPGLQKTVHFQALVRRFVRLYRRRVMRKELAAIHERLLSDDSHLGFRDRILKLFNH
jgi:hypothetical protein